MISGSEFASSVIPLLIPYGPHGSTGFAPPLNAVAIR